MPGDSKELRRLKTVPVTKKGKKERSDKGKFKRLERDEWALEWIGEQMVIRFDQLQRLLGRFAQRETKEPGVLALTSTKDVVNRWKARGLVEQEQLFGKKLSFIWLTEKGQKYAGLPYKDAFNPETLKIRHYYYLNEIRLQLEYDFGHSVAWTSERRLRFEKEFVVVEIRGEQRRHYADAKVIKDELDDEGSWQSISAIEAELSTKSKERTTQILTALAEKYENVYYYALPDVKAGVINRINTLPDTIIPTYKVRDLQKTF